MSMRLDRFISQATELSRKEAGKEIRKKRVSVAGDVVRDPAMQVDENATVAWRDEVLSLPGALYLMLHKPVGVVCAREDDFQETVMQFLPLELAEKVHIVGRLDKDTSGLLLLTDDGEWSHRITSPRRACEKEYRAQLVHPLKDEAEEMLQAGLQLRSEKDLTRPAKLQRHTETDVSLTIQEGRYHQVRRMFAALSNRVDELHRTRIGGLVLDAGLAPGEWRYLQSEEIDSVFV